MDITVIVPLYNEAESLPELERWIHRVMEANSFTYEILFIYLPKRVSVKLWVR